MPYITIRCGDKELGWRELDRPVVLGRQRESEICMIDSRLSRCPQPQESSSVALLEAPMEVDEMRWRAYAPPRNRVLPKPIMLQIGATREPAIARPRRRRGPRRWMPRPSGARRPGLGFWVGTM